MRVITNINSVAEKRKRSAKIKSSATDEAHNSKRTLRYGIKI